MIPLLAAARGDDGTRVVFLPAPTTTRQPLLHNNGKDGGAHVKMDDRPILDVGSPNHSFLISPLNGETADGQPLLNNRAIEALTHQETTHNRLNMNGEWMMYVIICIYL